MIVFLGFPGWTFFMVIPGIVVVILNGVWMGMLFGLTSARFRDVPQIAASITQVLFFITPIIWMPDMLPDRALLLDMNPAFHLLEIVRAPMLGALPDVESWFIAGTTTVLGWLVAITVYTIYRWRIAYWV
jgi:ABC-2 type transport system permease protein/lipopolysaccharide transport system permease protein